MYLVLMVYVSLWLYICDACSSRIWLAMQLAVWFWSLGICVNVIWSKYRANLCACRLFQKMRSSHTWKVLFKCDTTSWESRNTCRWWIPRWWELTKRPMMMSYSAWLLVANSIQCPLERRGVWLGDYMAQAAATRFCDYRDALSANSWW